MLRAKKSRTRWEKGAGKSQCKFSLHRCVFLDALSQSMCQSFLDSDKNGDAVKSIGDSRIQDPLQGFLRYDDSIYVPAIFTSGQLGDDYCPGAGMTSLTSRRWGDQSILTLLALVHLQ